MQALKIIVIAAVIAVCVIIALFATGCVAIAVIMAEIQEEQRHWNDIDDRKAR
jgi:outer membrane lipoprotein-sorting protein